MRHLKPMLTFCLCLTLLVTSVTSAVARGQMAAGRIVQICADGQAISVVLDERGNPVSTQHRCPECLAVTADLPPPAFDFGRPPTRWARINVPAVILHITITQLHAEARGPPALI
jgi:hypothetical protein